jgi:hypothetical protein
MVFEPAIPASERLHILALDRSATGIGPGTAQAAGLDAKLVVSVFKNAEIWF